MVKFGTSGLRGLAVDLTDDVVIRYIDAFLRAVPSEGPVLIGADLRDSSPQIRDAVAAACVRRSREPIDCGVLPTPALALAGHDRALAAIMVTGSHIPADRNGLKFYSPDGEITKKDEAAILSALEDGPQDIMPRIELSFDPTVLDAFMKRYSDFYSGRPLSGLRVGVYQHSSVARDILPKLLDTAGATPVPFGRTESFIPIDTEALDAETTRMLADWIERERLDAIVSTDGDADRPMLVDEQGQVIPGDIIGPLVAQSLGATIVVTPMSSSTVVERASAFDTVVRCRIGSPYVIDEMEGVGLDGDNKIVGYEANGGFFLGSRVRRGGQTLAPLATRDFALPLLEILRLTRLKGLTVSELISTLPRRRTASDRLQNVPSDTSLAMVGELLDGRLSLIPEEHGLVKTTDSTDGARFTLTSGRIVHIRPSGNAPELRCYVETEDQDVSNKLLSRILMALHEDIMGRD